MIRKSNLYIISATLLTSSALAGTMGPLPAAPAWSWVGSISIGPVWSNAGQTQTFYLAPEVEKAYIADKSSNVLVDGEVFVGVQKTLSQQIQAQLGLAVAATSEAKLSGAIWDDADPLFNNYMYTYKVRHTHVAVKGKLLADRGSWLIPWISGSLGVSFNDSNSFNSTPTIFEALPTPNFASHSNTSFTYTVGAGVQRALNPHWQVGAGYEFADWGQSNLNSAPGQTLGNGLALNHLYTNGVLFNLTYIA